jgi:hypothetical protein
VLFPTVGPAERERAHQIGLSRKDLSVLVHPIRYLKWRRDVHKNGPYAMAYDGPAAPRLTPVVALVFCIVALGAAATIIVLASSG